MNAHTPFGAPLGDLDAEALDWFVRRRRGLDAAEQATLQSWLAGDTARAEALARWQGDWVALDALPADGVAHLHRKLAADKAQARRATAAHGLAKWTERLRALMPRPAMAAFVLCVSGSSFLAWNHWQQQPIFEHTYATERGQQLDVQLPDGSRLRLDTATSVEVALYRQRRELRLPEGQIMLQVEGDFARPFDVLAGAVQVTVVGTRFSVRNTPGIPGDSGVRVAVEEGRVRVAPALAVGAGPRDNTASAFAIYLSAGQQVAADTQGKMGPVSGVADIGIAPWRDGRITFDNTPLAQVLAEFERYGRTGLIVRDGETAALRLTGTFDPRHISNFMLALPKVLPVRLREQDGFTEILPAS